MSVRVLADLAGSGGEFVLTEQRPRMQSRAEVVPKRYSRWKTGREDAPE